MKYLTSDEDKLKINAINKNPRTKADDAWKRVLDQWFQPFLQCFWPTIDSKIDWSMPIEELPQERTPLSAQSLVGKQIVDKLYKVYTKNGAYRIVLTHIEIQGDEEESFSTRLFQYWYRIYDYYKLPISTLVVLSDDNPQWRPKPFEIGGFDEHIECRYVYRYVKLLDWEGKEDSLLKSQNPFETLIAMHLRARQTRQSSSERFKIKMEIGRYLLEKGLKKDDILGFYTFLDGVMRLPDSLELEYHNTMINLEKERNVEYTLSAEHFGVIKGMKEGREKGRKEGREIGFEQAKLEKCF